MPYYACRQGERQEKWPGQQSTGRARAETQSWRPGGHRARKTVEQQTGIHIDHFIRLGLSGFVNVIDDLAASTCVPFTVKDPVPGLRLHAGEHHIGGVQALAFWRTREGIGTGSDLERIQRDQYLLAQVLHGILRSGLLSSPSRCWR